MSEENMLPEGTVVKCDACDSKDVYACIGVQTVYVCRECYNKIQLGVELSIDGVVDIRAGKLPKIVYTVAPVEEVVREEILIPAPQPMPPAVPPVEVKEDA